MLRFFIAIAVIAAFWWFLFRFKRVSLTRQKQMLSKFVLYGLAAVLILLVVTGRAPWFFAIIGAAIPWIQRLVVLKQAWNAFKPHVEKNSASPGQSTVTSEFLQMRLEHETQQMDGTILKGEHQGQLLSSLNLQQLQELWVQYAVDPDSQNLLRAYLEFRFDEQWHEGLSQERPSQNVSTDTQMTRGEASAILGLDDDAQEKDIILAHKKLMQKLHPDRGGSEYLASKINQAKSTLLS